MQLNITGHQLDITEAIRAYVTGKLEKLERHFDHITNVHVILSVDKVVHRAEAAVHVARGEVFAEAESEDMYAAIDQLIDKLDRQILRHKEKLVDRHHRASR